MVVVAQRLPILLLAVLLMKVSSSLPVGTIVMTGSSSAPPGWLLCDGTEVSRVAWSDLFSAIGTTFGAGNNSTSFNLPDLRGRAPVGDDDAGGRAAERITIHPGSKLGAAFGTETHKLTKEEMPSHQHSFPGLFNGGGAVAYFTAVVANSNSPAWSSVAGGDMPHPNVPPSLVVNFIIYAGESKNGPGFSVALIGSLVGGTTLLAGVAVVMAVSRLRRRDGVSDHINADTTPHYDKTFGLSSTTGTNSSGATLASAVSLDSA